MQLKALIITLVFWRLKRVEGTEKNSTIISDTVLIENIFLLLNFFKRKFVFLKIINYLNLKTNIFQNTKYFLNLTLISTPKPPWSSCYICQKEEKKESIHTIKEIKKPWITLQKQNQKVN